MKWIGGARGVGGGSGVIGIEPERDGALVAEVDVHVCAELAGGDVCDAEFAELIGEVIDE